MIQKVNSILIPVFLLLQPLLDVSVTIFPNIPISVIVRGLFLLYVIGCLLFKSQTRKITLLLLSIFLIYFLYNVFYLHFSLIDTSSAIFKFFYFIFIIYYFSTLHIPNIQKYLTFTLIIYLTLYLSSYLFHWGGSVYTKAIGKTGFRGLFYSINEISAILAILYCLCFSYLQKKPWQLIIISILIFFSSYLAGTKVLLGCLLLILVFNLFPKIKEKWTKRKKIEKVALVIFSVCLVSLFTYLFFQTSTYHNMVVQAKFFKIRNLFSFEGINKVIFNDRLHFLILNHTYFIKQNFLQWLLGIGYVNPLKLVEIDVFDILYRYGILGIIITVFTFIYLGHNIITSKTCVFAFVLLFLIALTSGHVILYPAVAIYLGIIAILSNNWKEKSNEKK